MDTAPKATAVVMGTSPGFFPCGTKPGRFDVGTCPFFLFDALDTRALSSPVYRPLHAGGGTGNTAEVRLCRSGPCRLGAVTRMKTDAED